MHLLVLTETPSRHWRGSQHLFALWNWRQGQSLSLRCICWLPYATSRCGPNLCSLSDIQCSLVHKLLNLPAIQLFVSSASHLCADHSFQFPSVLLAIRYTLVPSTSYQNINASVSQFLQDLLGDFNLLISLGSVRFFFLRH